MTNILNFGLKIKGGREGDTCEVLRPCHPPPPPQKKKKRKLKRAPRKGSELLKKVSDKSNVSDASGDRGFLGRIFETNVWETDDRQ